MNNKTFKIKTAIDMDDSQYLLRNVQTEQDHTIWNILKYETIDTF